LWHGPCVSVFSEEGRESSPTGLVDEVCHPNFLSEKR
jgi:hypothetical protein